MSLGWELSLNSGSDGDFYFWQDADGSLVFDCCSARDNFIVEGGFALRQPKHGLGSGVVPGVEQSLGLALADYRAGDLASAEKRIDGLLNSHPKRPDVQFAKGTLANAKGDLTTALAWFRASLELAPKNHETLDWAAFTCLRLARFAEAERYCRQLLGVGPNKARGYYLLASAQLGSGNLDASLDSIERSLQLRSNDAESHLVRARVLAAFQLLAPAIDSYRTSLRLRPSVSAAIDLSQILLRDAHPDQALELLSSVLPGLPEANRPYDLVAQSLTEMLQFEEAANYWKMARRFSRDPGSLIQRQAQAEMAAGRLEIALELLQGAIEEDLSAAECFSVLAKAKRMTESDRVLIERFRASSGAETLSHSTKAKLLFALGKSYDDLKDYEQAIWHFDAANKLCLEIFPQRRGFSREETSSLIDFQINFFSPERIANLSKQEFRTSLPLFVIGMVRSGTTLTENILGAHSGVTAGGEQMFWSQRARQYFQKGADGLRLDFELAKALAPDYLSSVAAGRESVIHVTDKNPMNVFLAPLLHCLFPEGKFIHVKRHPVDNLLSMWMTEFDPTFLHASNRDNLVFVYKEYLRWLRHLNAVMPEERFSTYQYEDLTSYPREQITSMLQFLSLPIEEDCFTPEKLKRSVLTPSVYQVRQPINRNSQERWKNYEPWLGAFAELLSDPA